ncbi:hypothetical protein Sjap_025381 [Stephania japonica]|uniref:Uncharacterized protein n=1 Tax=Stephania japonica TaxID=461633 RepID=A0AAP0E1H7_9MAGN
MAYDKACEHKVHRVDAQVEEESGATNLCYDEAWRRYLRSGERGLPVLGLGKRRRIGTPRSKAPGPDPRSTVVVPCHLRLPKKDCDSSETPPSVNDLYLHLHTVNHDRRHSSILDRAAPSGRREATRATPEQSVDDEAVYLNVAGECFKGHVYGLGSVGRKKRRYELLVLARRDAGCGAAGEFDVVAEQLRKVMNFMHRRLGMDMDEIGLAQRTTTTTATTTATS